MPVGTCVSVPRLINYTCNANKTCFFSRLHILSFPSNSVMSAIAVLTHDPSLTGVKQQFNYFAGFMG